MSEISVFETSIPEKSIPERNILVVVSGPSGVGKGTMVLKALELAPERKLSLALSVSMTSRSQRNGEVEGESYFFVDRERFQKAIEENELLEYNCYGSNYYGTPRAWVEKLMAEGSDVILEIDVNGGAQIKKSYPEVVRVFIMPPSVKELENRIRTRARDSEEDILRRLAESEHEISRADEYDYIIVNDDLEQATNEFLDIIEAEKKRVINLKGEI